MFYAIEFILPVDWNYLNKNGIFNVGLYENLYFLRKWLREQFNFNGKFINDWYYISRYDVKSTFIVESEDISMFEKECSISVTKITKNEVEECLKIKI